jgi:hypothetical protein
MATLLLSAAGSFVGGAIGGPLGAAIGRTVGAIGGAVLDQAIIGALTPARRVQGPRLTSVDITSSTEGAAITRLFGRSRLAGQMIWATRFEEEISKETTGGGKGFSGPKVTTTTYAYFANFAVALCEGPVTRIGRIWMDGRELDQTQATVRSYLGTEDQSADSLIVAKEGAGEAPAYRGVAYVVFERLPLEEYGNRMPVVTAEVFRAVGRLEPLVKGVALIPGSTEFGYEPGRGDPADRQGQLRGREPPHQGHRPIGPERQPRPAPGRGAEHRAGQSGRGLVRRRSALRRMHDPAQGRELDQGDPQGRLELSLDGGRAHRSTAQVMTQIDGRPAFGGAPNDASLIAGIQELKARGLPGDGLSVHHDGHRVRQRAARPLFRQCRRDRPVSLSVARPHHRFARSRVRRLARQDGGRRPDRRLPRCATAADFASSSGTTVSYAGPAEWSYRRFILHMAKICELAGGVDLFCIGSEMVGLTQARDGATSYPFVAGLIDLAGEVRTMLPAARIGYAADWSEYHSHRPGDGTGDVLFNLDPLWAHADIDFIGIDNYLPLADWRDGTEHLDYSSTGPTTTYDLDYLKGNIEGGEYYDWYYPAAGVTGNEASPERLAQTRTDIVDGSAAAEHWVFRQKDIRNWWLERPP